MTNPPTVDLGLGLGPTPQLDAEFVYVGDPMCSWCWGFSPVLEQLQARYAIPLRVVMGGLRTGSLAQPMVPEMRARMAGYWEQVEQQTGQPFTRTSLEREGWHYDTELSCRAVVAMRELAPRLTLPWLARLHRAFYVEGVDITDPAVFPDLLGGFDVDRDEYARVLQADATVERTRQDFDEAQQLGALGFPTVLLRDGETLGIVTRGYVPWSELEPALTAWLEQRYGELTTGLVCDPETGLC